MYRLWLMARSTVFWIWQIFITLLMGAPVLIGGLISFRVGYALALCWNYMNIYGLKFICGVSWRVEGKENIPDNVGLVLSKHQSTWETYFLPMMFYPAVYVAKRSLLWIPIFGWALYVLKFIMIDRRSGRSAINQMCEQARDTLDLGRWIIVFPEGTRRAIGSEPQYRIGGAVVAQDLQCDVVPVALNAGSYWPRMGYIKYPGVVTVRIGPVIKSKDKSAAEILAETQHWIESTMDGFEEVERNNV